MISKDEEDGMLRSLDKIEVRCCPAVSCCVVGVMLRLVEWRWGISKDEMQHLLEAIKVRGGCRGLAGKLAGQSVCAGGGGASSGAPEGQRHRQEGPVLQPLLACVFPTPACTHPRAGG